jgi:hypothetical protein
VNGIKESISCELHQRMKNISMKMAIGQALPCPPDACWHGHEIPAGYAKVGVDEIVTGFHDMELDIPGSKDERTLGGSSGWSHSMGQELHQASRLGATDNTAFELSQVTYTSITSKKPSP